ncbi:UNVERIFIED_CONTAM: hypothetical protein PYX00_004431 [Menopon gallinae]|uniref:Endonuclease/exonuclease/phosphatase domain-containing protein n=1 Tax=Menopon gallinae TaxID=328185 RepID=A0AAW2I463_9NEOP
MYPVFRKCVASKVDLGSCFKSIIKQNAINHSTYSTPKASCLVNVEKLQSSGVDKFEREEICSDRSIMTSRLEDACLGDDGHQCAAISYFTGNSLLERSSRICLPCEQGEKYSHYSTKEDQPESIYNAHTVHLLEDIKQKLSWIRHTQYSYYGEELVKDNKLKSIQNELISVATYNVLSQELLEKHNYLYSSHDHRSLRWSIRRDILLEELALLNADVLCLQEVDSYLVESFYDSFLNEKGYQGVYKRRTHGKIDGCAIYFKSDKFNLVESSKVEFFMESVRLLNRDNIGIVLKLSLKDRPDVELIAATTHLLYNPKRADIKLAQTQVMLAEIERLAYKSTDPNTSLPKYLPIIFTGDMNYSPDSAIYQLVTKSHLSYEGMSNKYLLPYADGFILQKTLLPAAAGVTDTCQYASSLRKRENSENLRFESGALDHNLKLSSVYNHVKKDCPEATTNQEKWVTVDYIFYSQPEENECGTRKDGNLKLVSKLSLPNSVEAETELRNIPNLACASDHLPLLATFHLSGS